MRRIGVTHEVTTSRVNCVLNFSGPSSFAFTKRFYIGLKRFLSSHWTPVMPLDTSTYSLALLRLDGRRWNELRRIHAQISTQAAADGSSYLEMGNTMVI